MAAHSPPDGYTVFLVNPANAINATLYKNLSFDFLRDMAPVAGFIRVPNVMEVNPNVPAHTVKEFIDYAKANPGKVNMASAGIGTSTHLSGALFMMMTGVNLVHVPYRGAAPALTDHARRPGAGVCSTICRPRSRYIKAGRLRALAVTTATRATALPDVPTSPRPCRAMRRAPCSAWRCRRERRATSSRSSTAPSTTRSPIRRMQAQARRARRHPDRRHAGGFRQAHRRRNRQMGQGGQGHRRNGGVGTCVATKS